MHLNKAIGGNKKPKYALLPSFILPLCLQIRGCMHMPRWASGRGCACRTPSAASWQHNWFQTPGPRSPIRAIALFQVLQCDRLLWGDSWGNLFLNNTHMHWSTQIFGTGCVYPHICVLLTCVERYAPHTHTHTVTAISADSCLLQVVATCECLWRPSSRWYATSFTDTQKSASTMGPTGQLVWYKSRVAFEMTFTLKR